MEYKYQDIWHSQLNFAIEQGYISASQKQQQQLLQYLEILYFWQQHHNLTTIKPEEYIHKHILDSLVLSNIVKDKVFLDVGTGAGFPGIPLAIFSSCKHAVLLDSSRKKTSFLLQAIHEIGLDNVAIENKNVVEYHPVDGFELVVCRAFAPLAKIIALVKHTLTTSGSIWAMKASLPDEELNNVNCYYEVKQVKIANLDLKRCLVKMVPSKNK